MRAAWVTTAIAAVMAVVAVGCRGNDREPPRSTSKTAPQTAPAPTPPAAAGDLLAQAPADAVFAFATLAPVPADAWARLTAELGPVFQRLSGVARTELAAGVDDPASRLGLAVLAEVTAGPLLTPRVAAYDLLGATVIRIETTDAAALTAALERAVAAAGNLPREPGTAPRWFVEGLAGAVHIAAEGRELVIATGASAVVRGAVPVLTGATPLPGPALGETALRQLATEHGLAPQLVGFVDAARLADRVRTSPALYMRLGLDAPPTPACRDALAQILALVPRAVIGTTEVSATRLEIAAEMDLDPQQAAALRAAQRPIAGIPAGFAGSPLVGIALAGTDGSGDSAWRGKLLPIVAACRPDVAFAMMATSAPTILGAALVIYGGTMSGFLPKDIDGYATVATADPDELLRKARSAGLGARPPRDGGPFVTQTVRKLGVTTRIDLARRGNSVILASGAQGRAAAEAALAPTGPAPFFQLVVDVARFVRWSRELDTTADPQSKDTDRVLHVDDSVLADAGLDAAESALAGTLSLALTAGDRGLSGRVAITLAPPAVATPPPEPPPIEVVQCRRLIARGWRQAAAALPHLGVTAQVDEIERTYKSSLDTRSVAKDCLALDPAARECLLADPDVLAAVRRCEVGRFDLPALFSFFGPHPLEDRFPSGKPVPLPDERSFLVPLSGIFGSSGWLARDATGCRAVSDRGLVIDARCTFADRDGGRWLDVSVPVPCGAPGGCPTSRTFRVERGTLVEP